MLKAPIVMRPIIDMAKRRVWHPRRPDTMQHYREGNSQHIISNAHVWFSAVIRKCVDLDRGMDLPQECVGSHASHTRSMDIL